MSDSSGGDDDWGGLPDLDDLLNGGSPPNPEQDSPRRSLLIPSTWRRIRFRLWQRSFRAGYAVVLVAALAVGGVWASNHLSVGTKPGGNTRSITSTASSTPTTAVTQVTVTTATTVQLPPPSSTNTSTTSPTGTTSGSPKTSSPKTTSGAHTTSRKPTTSRTTRTTHHPVVTHKTYTKTVSIPQPATQRVNDSNLPRGSEKTVQKGHSGTQVLTYRQKYVDGKKSGSAQVTGRETTKAAVPTIIHVGTYVPPKTTHSEPPPPPPPPAGSHGSQSITCSTPAVLRITVTGSSSATVTVSVSGAGSGHGSGKGSASASVSGGPGTFAVSYGASSGGASMSWSGSGQCH